MKQPFKNIPLKQRVIDRFRELKNIQGNPLYLSRGVAIGCFIGVVPIMPLKSILIISLTILFSGSTAAAILVCTLICNPLTYVPLYYIAWYVGNLLLPGRASWEALHATMQRMISSGFSEALSAAAQAGLDTSIVLLTGGCIIAIPFAVLSYPIAYSFFSYLRRNENT